MARMSWLRKAPAWAGSVILLLGAGYHLSALPFAREQAAAGIESAFLRAVSDPLWIMPSAHWAVFAVVAVLAILSPSGLSRWILLLISAAVLADAAMIAAKLGPFIGAIMLGLASALIGLSALLIPRRSATG